MEMVSLYSIVVSTLALTVSAFTLWLTFLRKGEIKMTQPAVIYFGPDKSDKVSTKIFLRTILYSTARRGKILETMYVRLRRGETQQNFNIWVYGDKQLTRGSGLFVSHEGFATNHHFLTPADTRSFDLLAGDYTIEVFVRVVGLTGTRLLTKVPLSISEQQAEKLKTPDSGIYFDWGPDADKYHSHVDHGPKVPIDRLEFLK